MPESTDINSLRTELVAMRRVVDQQTSDQRALNVALLSSREHLVDLRTHFTELLAANEVRLKDRHALEQDALKNALTANDKRLETMNEFRETISDVMTRMMPRKESEDRIHSVTLRTEIQFQTVSEKLEARLQPIQQQLAQLGKPNWTLVISVFSVLTAIVLGGWAVVGLKIDAAIVPYSLEITQIKVGMASDERSQSDIGTRLRTSETQAATSLQADAQSRTDRAQLNDRVKGLEQTVTTGGIDRRANDARLSSGLIEIQTQMQSITNVIGLYRNTTERWIAILYEHAFPGQRMPVSEFVPQLAQTASGTNR